MLVQTWPAAPCASPHGRSTCRCPADPAALRPEPPAGENIAAHGLTRGLHVVSCKNYTTCERNVGARVNVRTHDATWRAILRVTCQLHRVSTSEIVARNIARNASTSELYFSNIGSKIEPCSRFEKHSMRRRNVTNGNRPIGAPVHFCLHWLGN